MSKFNGMVQGLVPASVQDRIISSLYPTAINNTMKPEQRAHHVTLAYKPDDIEGVRVKFATRRIGFAFSRMLARNDIAAILGAVVDLDSGEVLIHDAHITLGGTAAPKDAGTLSDNHNYEEEAQGFCLLEYHEVEF